MGVSNFSIFTAFKAKDGISPVFKTMSSASDKAATRFKAGMDKAKIAVTALKTTAVATAAAITTIGTAAAVPYKAFSDWEKGIKTVYTLLSKDELATYGDKLKDASKHAISLGVSVEDSNKALFDAVSAFGMNDKTLDIYNQALVLAKAGNADLSTSLTGIVSVVNAWGAKTTDVTAVANAFFTAQKNGVTTVSELASAIGEVAPMAKAMGISMDETMASMAALTKGGLSTDAATTALRATLTALAKPSKEAAETLPAFGVPCGITQVKAAGLTKTLQKLIELQQKSPDAVTKAIPNVRALTGVLAMDNEKMQEVHRTLGMIQSDIKNGTGLNEALEMMNSSSATVWARMLGEYRQALIDIGETLAPYINPLIKAFGEFAPILSGAVIPALKITILSIPSHLNGIINTYHFIKDNWIPVLLMLPAVILGVRIAIDVLRLKMALLRMEGGLLSVIMRTKLMTALSGFTAGVWKSVTALLAQAAAFAVTPWGIAIIAITAIIGVIVLLWKNWDKVTATVSSWWQTTQTALSAFWTKCQEVFGVVGNFIKTHFVDVLLLALGPVGVIISALKNMPSLLKSIKNGGKGIELKTSSDGKDASNPKIQESPGKGKIGVDVNLTNKTDKNAKVSTTLESSNSLELSPN